jgi:hypothetical protein
VWGIAPRATLSAQADHNLPLTNNDNEDVNQFGASALVGLQAVRYDDSSNWVLSPQFFLVRYPELRRLNRDESQVTSVFTQYFERGEWPISATYLRDTTITSERGASGITENNLPHERISIATSPSWQLTPLWTASGAASWSADSYSDARATGLVDYDYGALNTQLQYSLGEHSSAGLSAAYGRLWVPAFRSTKDQQSINITFTGAFSELWSWSVAGGPLRVVTEQLTDTGIGYSARLQRQAEITSVSIAAARDIAPDGRGVLSTRERITAGFSYRLSSDTNWQWSRNRDAVPALELRLDTVRYLSVDGAMRWQATPTVSVALAAGWRRQTVVRVVGDDTADAYSASLSLTWQGLERTY